MRVIFIKSFLYLCSWLPLRMLHGIGGMLGTTLRLIPGKMQSVAARNIELCFPEYSLQQRQLLLSNSLKEMARTLLEMGTLWLRDSRHVLQLIRHVDGADLVERAIADGKGVILATPHLGAWEAAGLYCASRFDITCLYRPLHIVELESLVNKARSRAGGQYVPANANGVRTLYKTLETGGTVAMLPDQEPQAGTGVFAPFFGIPAFTMVFLSRLGAKSGAPIIFVWCERLPRGKGYALHFRATPPEASGQDITRSVEAINKTVENCIRECPAQYQWGYKRFRTRPKGEPPIYQSTARK